MKINVLIILMLSTICYTPLSQAVDCGPFDVSAIQTQKHDVLIKVETATWSAWKALGLHTDASTKAYQAIAQQALATNSKIYLRYLDGHNCAAADYGTRPEMIRIYK